PGRLFPFRVMRSSIVTSSSGRSRPMWIDRPARAGGPGAWSRSRRWRTVRIGGTPCVVAPPRAQSAVRRVAVRRAEQDPRHRSVGLGDSHRCEGPAVVASLNPMMNMDEDLLREINRLAD